MLLEYKIETVPMQFIYIGTEKFYLKKVIATLECLEETSANGVSMFIALNRLKDILREEGIIGIDKDGWSYLIDKARCKKLHQELSMFVGQ